MKKNFLLLLLMTLLPLAMWAQKPSGVDTEPALASSPITWDGNQHQLITTAATPVSGYHDEWAGGHWVLGGWNEYYDDHAGIQYYVKGPGDPDPQNGYSSTPHWTIFGTWYEYHLRTSVSSAGVITDVANSLASAVGSYTIYYRIMRDHNNPTGNYQTSDWFEVGTVTIEKPAISDMPYYVNGPQRVSGLVYNDGDQELITAGTDFCANYVQSGVKYVVKTTHALPTAEEELAATTTLPTGKNAGTYYVYYKILKDGVYYTNDGMWTEVGVGGITIDKRPITDADFAIEFKEGLVYNGSAQDLVKSFAWTGGIDRTATTTPAGAISYKVN